MSPVEPGAGGYVDALPSSVVARGFFSPAQRLAISKDDHLTRVGGFSLGSHDSSLDAAKSWIRTWQAHAVTLELDSSDQPESKWFPPYPLPDHFLKRVLVSLGSLVAPARIDEIVQKVNERFQVRTRTNNTWRTIRARDDLFVVSDEMEIALSPKGVQWLTVLRRYETPSGTMSAQDT